MVKSCTDRSGMKTTHYDESGNKIGESRSSPGGQVRHYDTDGNFTGRSFKSPSVSGADCATLLFSVVMLTLLIYTLI